MMTCKTRFHGPLSFRPQDVLEVPSGLFGFEGETQFLLLEVPSSKPIVFIQSVRSPQLCFISLPVQIVDPGYKLELNLADLEVMGYSAATPPETGKDVLCLALLTIRGEEETTANLQAPLVVDIKAHRARQVLVNNRCSHQYPFPVAKGQFAC